MIEVRGHIDTSYCCYACGESPAEVVRVPREMLGPSVSRMVRRTADVESTLPLSAMERFYSQRRNSELRDDLVELLEELAG
jgi:hypothetical protein